MHSGQYNAIRGWDQHCSKDSAEHMCIGPPACHSAASGAVSRRVQSTHSGFTCCMPKLIPSCHGGRCVSLMLCLFMSAAFSIAAGKSSALSFSDCQRYCPYPPSHSLRPHLDPLLHYCLDLCPTQRHVKSVSCSLKPDFLPPGIAVLSQVPLDLFGLYPRVDAGVTMPLGPVMRVC